MLYARSALWEHYTGYTRNSQKPSLERFKIETFKFVIPQFNTKRRKLN
jgi:hypothetical protein